MPSLSDIDRITPTQRPAGSACGYQLWRSLLFMHWRVPSQTLRELVPASLELDLFDGEAFIGLVPFAMEDVRPWWAPRSIGFNFLETNVRTYVTHRGKPGVYFFSLEAASRIAVWAARKFWGLPYHHAQMSYSIQNDIHSYRSTRSSNKQPTVELEVSWEVGDRCQPSQQDSLEFFFLERYLLFVQQNDKTYSGQVHHTPYPFHSATIGELRQNLLSANGMPSCDALPDFVHYSPGVDVDIFRIVNS